MKNNSQIVLFVITLLSPMVSAMQPLNESQLGEVTGEGIGATFDDVVIHSGNYGQPDDFKLRLRLSDGPDSEMLIMSELRFYRSGAEPGTANSGGFFGTYDDPFVVGELREITEQHVGSIDPQGDGTYESGSRTHVAFYTGFPAADLTQKERGFFQWTGNRMGVGNTTPRYANQSTSYYRGLPNDFFSGNASVNIGNLFSLTSEYQTYLQEQEDRLDLATNKFDLHFRLDAITDENRNKSTDEQFLGYVDVEGARLYGTSTMIWAHSNQGERLSAADLARYQNGGAPVYADRGLAMAMTTGLRADTIRITADPSGAAASVLELQGVDMYLPMGSVDQPMTISTVQFSQISRGTWKNPVMVAPSTQLRLEIAALPKDVAQAPQGNIFIQSLAFGDPDDSEIITGIEDIYLRDATGNIVTTVDDVKHRAFVPKTVIYNEQVAAYNQANPSSPLPFIPNQNVVEVRGLEIQRLVITTQDLNR
ncbi:MAG: hypothetical protein LRY66_13885 [Saccharospirillaceae bacterium]|nr:hypothetical protein [Saccharospirillaceae bacterium]MCD8532400.1 hypothetical protein [Saccharospirillaceae bacterium]